jgi:hypothetical protein
MNMSDKKTKPKTPQGPKTPAAPAPAAAVVSETQAANGKTPQPAKASQTATTGPAPKAGAHYNAINPSF